MKMLKLKAHWESFKDPSSSSISFSEVMIFSFVSPFGNAKMMVTSPHLNSKYEIRIDIFFKLKKILPCKNLLK